MPDQAAAHGPIDFILLEFPEEADTKACAEAIMDQVRRGVIRVYDVLLMRKALDGSYSAVEFSDVSTAGVGGFSVFEGARSGLIHDDDLREAVEVVQPGTMAALIVFENTWAAPFASAASEAGGELIASQRIPAPDLIEALERLEAGQSG
jgi:hypothetical protein